MVLSRLQLRSRIVRTVVERESLIKTAAVWAKGALFALALAVAFGMVACGKDSTPTPTGPTGGNPTPTPTPNPTPTPSPSPSPSPCSYSLSETAVTFESNGGTRSVTVNTGGGCAWTATSNVPWITISSGASGTGTGDRQLCGGKSNFAI